MENQIYGHEKETELLMMVIKHENDLVEKSLPEMKFVKMYKRGKENQLEIVQGKERWRKA